MYISHHIACQLANEHIGEVRPQAGPRGGPRRRRLALRRLRILNHRPLAAPAPRAGR